MGRNQQLGARGEDLAAEFLESVGMVVLERNWRCRYGELDLVARDGAVLVFVEVRARSGSGFGTPFESVTWQKRLRLSRMAAAYVGLKRLGNEPCRFDVVAVIEGDGERTIELLKGAFDMESLR